MLTRRIDDFASVGGDADGGFRAGAAASRLAAAAAAAELEYDGVRAWSFDDDAESRRRASVSRMGEGGEAHNDSLLESTASLDLDPRRISFSAAFADGGDGGVAQEARDLRHRGAHSKGAHAPALSRAASLRHDEDLAAAVAAVVDSTGRHCDAVDAYLNAKSAARSFV